MNKSNHRYLLIGAILVGAFAFQATALAKPSAASTSARQNRIVGVWEVDVSVNSCMNGAPLFTFMAMHKFEMGGTGQVVPATNPAALSAHLMVWEHLGGSHYRTATKFFRFEGGAPVGWNIIVAEVELSEDGTLYGGSGVASVYDLNGNLLMASCPSFAGTRFTTEP